MCETVAYMIEEGKEITVLEDVVTAIPEDGKVRVVNLFGEERVVAGRISQVDLLKHRILIAPPRG